jgi:hypothetical protein
MTEKLQRPEQLALDFAAVQPAAVSEPPPAGKSRQKAEKPVALIHREANAVEINQRRSDGYLDATAMCRAYDKRFAHYRENSTTTEFLDALSADVGIPISELVQSTRRSAGQLGGGTWVHPQVAINLAQWVSAKFAVLVTRWVLDWMQGRQPDLRAGRQIEPFVIGRMIEAVQATAENAVTKADQALRQSTETQLDLWRNCHEFDGRLRKLEGPAPQPKTDEPHPGDWRTWRVRRVPK